MYHLTILEVRNQSVSTVGLFEDYEGKICFRSISLIFSRTLLILSICACLCAQIFFFFLRTLDMLVQVVSFYLILILSIKSLFQIVLHSEILRGQHFSVCMCAYTHVCILVDPLIIRLPSSVLEVIIICCCLFCYEARPGGIQGLLSTQK